MAIDRTAVDPGKGPGRPHARLVYDHTMFAPQIEALEDRYRIIAYNIGPGRIGAETCDLATPRTIAEGA